jgi:hypothetical protein
LRYFEVVTGVAWRNQELLDSWVAADRLFEGDAIGDGRRGNIEDIED